MVWISIKEPAVPKALAEALGEKVGCICTDIDRLRLIYGFAKKAITDDLVLPRDVCPLFDVSNVFSTALSFSDSLSQVLGVSRSVIKWLIQRSQ